MSFTVYKSSAGSGKTFTLVKEYLKLVLSNPLNFRNILAITFTTKASAEMKERIIFNLKELSQVPQLPESKTIKNLLPILIRETGLSPEKISMNAAAVLKLLLHQYSDFAVSTIDSFTHRLIRSFAFDLRIPMNFEVDTDDETILEQAVNLLIGKTGSDAYITKTLVEFTENRTEDEKSWNIEEDLYDFSRILLTEEDQKNIADFKNLSAENFEHIRKILGKEISRFENEIAKLGQQGLDIITSHHIGIYDFYFGTKGIGKYFEYLQSKRTDKSEANKYVRETIENGKFYTEKTDPKIKALIDPAKEALSELGKKILSFISEHYTNYLIHEMIFKKAYQMAVLNEIKKITEEIRKEKNILSISEFNKRISDVVQQEPVPFIYERIGEKFRNYMIDEFQDTSIMQWQNLLPLVDNSLAEGNYTMIVGDGKQAIYRFRNGEAGQFVSLPKLYKAGGLTLDHEQSLTRNYEEKHLDSNYRSKAEIVDFNNRFYEYVKSVISEENQKIYAGHKQKYESKNTGGFVQIQFLSNESDKNKAAVYQEEIEKTILKLRNEHFRFSDIAILCRFNKNATDIASYLIDRDFPVISSESVLLSNSEDVRFIISFLRYLVQPENKIACAEVLHFLVSKRIIEADFNELLLLQNSSSRVYIIELLHKTGIQIQTGFLKSLPLYELVEEVIRLFKLNSVTHIYLPSFLDVVQQFSLKNGESPDEFLQFWEEKKDKLSVRTPEGTDAIQVMSIHKSKGLEFPVVIYPYVEEKLKITKDHLWIEPVIDELPFLKKALVATHKDLEKTKFADQFSEEKEKSHLDLINLMYVAMTRPSERLYLFSYYENKINESLESTQGLIYNFLQTEKIWKEDEAVYTFGNTQNPAPKKNQENLMSVTLTKMLSGDWRKRIILRRKAPELWNIYEPEKNKDWGNLVHCALSKIHSFDETPKAINQLESEGLLQKDQKEKLSGLLDSLLSEPAIKEFFKPGLEVKTEVEIIDTDGRILRPDRIIIDGEKVIVIDYKTGQPSEHHKRQMAVYAGVLEKMGYKTIEKYLMYVEKNKIINCETTD